MLCRLEVRYRGNWSAAAVGSIVICTSWDTYCSVLNVKQQTSSVGTLLAARCVKVCKSPGGPFVSSADIRSLRGRFAHSNNLSHMGVLKILAHAEDCGGKTPRPDLHHTVRFGALDLLPTHGNLHMTHSERPELTNSARFQFSNIDLEYCE